ncbi:hypothetical protein [uncultured Clostridium sp.]|uniref:hypothetical protein n=1 Tax=uncultured Clostridium sp. TaxID=59620 RepID=UPI0025E6C22C|nr:hypothetical protein [uncultured Clostridium sp.]
MHFNEWQKEGNDWYRSNAEGIAYQNEWFKDTDGKWYYFGNDCKMVRNKLINILTQVKAILILMSLKIVIFIKSFVIIFIRIRIIFL